MAKITALLLACFAVIFFLFNPSAKQSSKESSFLYANPLIAKAVLGSFSPFFADFAWLESTKIGEIGKADSQKVDPKEIKTAFLTITTLDPSFYHAINYGVSFLSSIPKDKEGADEILDRGILLHPNDFQLRYTKLVLEVTSDVPDNQKLISLAKEVFANPAFKGVFGVMYVDDFLLDIIKFASDKEAKKTELIKELEWLYKNTKDDNKKLLIKQRLSELGATTLK